jgi:MoaA/NifB/PqqE/SkfB family radical SAM enzyme
MSEKNLQRVDSHHLDHQIKTLDLSTEEIRKALPENFCPLPFTHLFLYPTGKVFPCCESGYNLGDLTKSTVEEIWNGEKLHSLREEFLTGNIKTCSSQVKYKHCHLANEHLLPVTIPSKFQEEPVRSFDFILNGKCNLECVMCPVWTLPNQVYDKTTFWSEGQETIFPKLKRISVKSGEPFIQKDTYRLIELVSAVNQDCIWEFTTNGHYRLTPYILEHLDRIQIDCIKVSIDSLQESIYPMIRKRGDLKRVLETLDGFIKYRDKRSKLDRHFELGVNMAVQKQNWQEPPKLIALCEQEKLSPIFIYVFSPESESISSLPLDERIEILDYYFHFLKTQKEVHGKFRYVKNLRTIILPIMGGLPEEIRSDYLESWRSVGGSLCGFDN